ncbi:MAG TPA: hypothetical protein VG056_16350 [Pirellulales bacterium]|nr:hypothetical protein [Pirellulales bacterium]
MFSERQNMNRNPRFVFVFFVYFVVIELNHNEHEAHEGVALRSQESLASVVRLREERGFREGGWHFGHRFAIVSNRPLSTGLPSAEFLWADPRTAKLSLDSRANP